MLVCLCILRNRRGYDDLEDSARMGNRTILYNVRAFCVELKLLYGEIFLNPRPTKGEIRILRRTRGVPVSPVAQVQFIA